MKHTSWIKISGIAGIVLLISVIARFLLGGSEDEWICINGSWAKHGNPLAPKPPDSTCGYPKVDLH